MGGGACILCLCTFYYFARSLLSAMYYCHDYSKSNFGSGPAWEGELELYFHGYSNYFGSGPGGVHKLPDIPNNTEVWIQSETEPVSLGYSMHSIDSPTLLSPDQDYREGMVATSMSTLPLMETVRLRSVRSLSKSGKIAKRITWEDQE